MQPSVPLTDEIAKNIWAIRTKSVSSTASKYKPKGDMKATDEESKEPEKNKSWLTKLDLLNVIHAAFPNVRVLLRLFVLVPQS